MTVRGLPAEFGGGEIDNRRTILSRARTDTMYRVREGSGPSEDFDLSEFAAAAGDAMAHVNAEDQSAKQVEVEMVEDSGADDGFIEVDPAEEEFERKLEEDAEEEDLAAVSLDPTDREGAPEPEERPRAESPPPPAQSEDITTDKLEDAMDEVVEAQEKDSTGEELKELEEKSPVETAKAEEILSGEAESEEHVPLEQGEVKAVPVHLGLDSEATE